MLAALLKPQLKKLKKFNGPECHLLRRTMKIWAIIRTVTPQAEHGFHLRNTTRKDTQRSPKRIGRLTLEHVTETN
jgi:hypothetical protein